MVQNFLNTEFFLEKKQHLAISDQYYDQFFSESHTASKERWRGANKCILRDPVLTDWYDVVVIENGKLLLLLLLRNLNQLRRILQVAAVEQRDLVRVSRHRPTDD